MSQIGWHGLSIHELVCLIAGRLFSHFVARSISAVRAFHIASMM